MNYLLLADIHSNLEALVTSLKDFSENFSLDEKTFSKIHNSLKPYNIDITPKQFSKDETKIVSLGDIVGYGPDANDCTSIIRELADLSVVGNHEHYLFGQQDNTLTLSERFGLNGGVLEALALNYKDLSQVNIDFLRNMVDAPRVIYDKDLQLGFSHAIPSKSKDFLYPATDKSEIFRKNSVEKLLTFRDAQTYFMGHAHVSGISSKKSDYLVELVKNTFNKDDISASTISLKKYLKKNSELVLVPSIGQPRDGDNRSGYAVYDSKTKDLIFRRVPYDIMVSVKKLVYSGYPKHLVMRLVHGT